MAEIDSRTHKRSDDQDVANSGFIRPPVVYLIAILAGLGLDLVRPLRWLPAEIGIWVGIPLVIASLVLFFSSARRFKAADTPVPGNKPTTAIVRSGPYRFSRNPIYLAFSILMLGIACWRNSGWILATLGGAAGVMSGVDPVSWTPEYLRWRCPRWPRVDDRTRRSSGNR